MVAAPFARREPADAERGCDCAGTVLAAASCAATVAGSLASDTMSKSDARRLRFVRLFWRMKYFCACEATCVGVRVFT